MAVIKKEITTILHESSNLHGSQKEYTSQSSKTSTKKMSVAFGMQQNATKSKKELFSINDVRTYSNYYYTQF